MKTSAALALVALNLASVSCRTAPAKDSPAIQAAAELADGLAARERGDSRSALQHAQRAAILVPQMTEAHFALGLIADDLCVPNADPGPDMRICGLGMQEYKTVLEMNPTHADALKNLAYLLYNFNRMDESESYYRKALALHADDPDLLGAIAAIDMKRSCTNMAMIRAVLKLTAQWPLIPSPDCDELRRGSLARVEEGIAFAMRGLQIRKNNTELMLFLNVLYSMRATMQCGNPPRYQADIAAAREWNRQRKDTSKKGIEGDSLQRCPPPPPPPLDDEEPLTKR